MYCNYKSLSTGYKNVKMLEFVELCGAKYAVVLTCDVYEHSIFCYVSAPNQFI